MKISKVYYEELRSVCVDDKWTNKKIGVEVEVGEHDMVSENLKYAKSWVRGKLDGEVEIEDNKKYKEAFEKVRKSVEYELGKIEEEELLF